ncbi:MULTISPECIES: cytochrome b5-like heme/steroid binding domain-containing protein [unclassified Thioalkalivibrio]|uniref:cytochrome b5 domain-containing protein n=1 Tax=unclassified Thioalkalivibrio TaxID=2621013 RepID=UPI000365B66E|nr:MULTISPECIES: cytochrome b5-like heme/steroid binding domain-containing protein [unclassified Thioalkalivibrio]
MTRTGQTLYTLLVAFIASLLTLLAVHLLGPDTTPPVVEGDEGITHEELARHASEDDCWMAIHGVVYDFTEYLPRHPTPIEDDCGTDASHGWDTKGTGRPHSRRAHDMLPDYRIGVLAGEGSP